MEFDSNISLVKQPRADMSDIGQNVISTGMVVMALKWLTCAWRKLDVNGTGTVAAESEASERCLIMARGTARPKAKLQQSAASC